MTTTNPTPAVYGVIAAIMGDLGNIEKRRVNAGPAGSFNAFAVDDIYTQLHPLFAQHGLVVTPHVLNVEYVDGETSKGGRAVDARVHVQYTFAAVSDGSTVTASYVAEGRDTQDKAATKAMQQALKYCLVQTFLISTGEPDSDRGAPETVTRNPRTRPAPHAGTEAASPDVCPACAEDGRESLLWRNEKAPFWKCRADSECAAYDGRYAWSGWHETLAASIEEWRTKQGLPPADGSVRRKQPDAEPGPHHIAREIQELADMFENAGLTIEDVRAVIPEAFTEAQVAGDLPETTLTAREAAKGWTADEAEIVAGYAAGLLNEKATT